MGNEKVEVSQAIGTRFRTSWAVMAARLGAALPGSLVVRSLRCGRPGCACNAHPPQLHGPYVQWSYGFPSPRVNRWLEPDQVQHYRSQVERGRHLKELLAELDAAEILRVEREQGWGA